MQLDRSDYTPFMDGVKEIFLSKMAKGKTSNLKGWSARTMLKEIIEEQSLTPAETDIAWGILTVDILGYDDKKIKELYSAKGKKPKGFIYERNTSDLTSDAQGSSDLLYKSIGVDLS